MSQPTEVPSNAPTTMLTEAMQKIPMSVPTTTAALTSMPASRGPPDRCERRIIVP
ncbi:MAG: hypothetical protein P8Y85_05610 [Nitrospirota bacterium]